jgi:hypothetical protein
MKKIGILMMVLALVVAFSGLALAGDFGMCDYSTQAKKVAADKANTTKNVASKSSPNIDTGKLTLAQQSEQSGKAATDAKK